MKKIKLYKNRLQIAIISTCVFLSTTITAVASSHREAPLIADDPLADNTDLYAFRSPDDPNTVTIIANYIPLQLPHGGPNYYSFGENIRYEIHIDNNIATLGDDIIYRFTFTRTDEDPTTFFNIRLGAENIKMTYTCEKSTDGGLTFSSIIIGGIVPPPYIGERSIEDPVVGLGTTYEALIEGAITGSATGETVYCGPSDDPFFVDLGGIFDLGDAPRLGGTPHDGVACYNAHSIAIKIPINMLQKDGLSADDADDILDGDFVIGIWASASRPALRTLNADGTISTSGDWIQVSRLGMPLTNEAVIPIGGKDYWNSLTPYNEDPAQYEYFYNPELGLYMDDALFGGAVPGLSALRIQKASLGAYGFGNGQDGLFALKGSPAVAGTALDDAIYGTLLLPAAGKPRSVDLWPIFYTGAPNFPPYQLATGKLDGNPLAVGKPFINNFLPNGGDMLRLNMAVPITDRSDPNFSSLGLIQAAVLGLTDPTYATTSDLQFIPNMDGFPNGRRLEDDVTRIELQAVSGIVLAAIGLWYDDYIPGVSTSPVTTDLLDVLTYTTGVENNDTTFKTSFPYVQTPWSGTGKCSGVEIDYAATLDCSAPTGLSAETTETTASLTWVPTESASFYQVVYKSMAGGIHTVTSTTPGAELTGLTPCTNYAFKILIKCGGLKLSSDWVLFTTDGEGCEKIGFVSENGISVYPNPTSNELGINYVSQYHNEVRIKIIDNSGKVFISENVKMKIGQNQLVFDVSKFTNGVYYVEITNGNSKVTDKFIVNR